MGAHLIDGNEYHMSNIQLNLKHFLKKIKLHIHNNETIKVHLSHTTKLHISFICHEVLHSVTHCNTFTTVINYTWVMAAGRYADP